MRSIKVVDTAPETETQTRRQHMSDTAKTAALAGVEPFGGWPPARVAAFAARCAETVAAPGSVLAHHRQSTGPTYLILSGEASLTTGGAVDVVGPGTLVGPASSEGTVTAVTLMHLLELPTDDTIPGHGQRPTC